MSIATSYNTRQKANYPALWCEATTVHGSVCPGYANFAYQTRGRRYDGSPHHWRPLCGQHAHALSLRPGQREVILVGIGEVSFAIYEQMMRCDATACRH